MPLVFPKFVVDTAERRPSEIWQIDLPPAAPCAEQTALSTLLPHSCLLGPNLANLSDVLGRTFTIALLSRNNVRR